jgi:hypothetical protein
MKVVFTGKICDIPENVRFIGAPFKLSGIKDIEIDNIQAEGIE